MLVHPPTRNLKLSTEISIVIPVYQTEAYLEECLDSILSQEHVSIEIICVNDQSPDNSLAILKKYQERFPKTITIIDQENTGGATAINNGIRAASGEYILIVDSDDYVLPGGLSTLHGSAKAEAADMVIGRITRLENGSFTNVADTAWLTRNEVLDGPNGREKLFRDMFYHGKLIRRELLRREDRLMVDGLLYADGPFVSKLYVEAGKIVLMASNVVVWRKRSDADARSITDRKLELSTLHDHVRSVNLDLDNAVASGNESFVSSLAQVDSRRLVWHLLPAWRAGIFSLSYLDDFFGSVNSYYDRLKDIKFHGQPKTEAVLIWALVGQRKKLFFLLCLIVFLWHQVKRGKTALKKAVKNIVPVSVIRQFRKRVPNYVGHKVFRRFLKYVPQHQHMVLFESFFGK